MNFPFPAILRFSPFPVREFARHCASAAGRALVTASLLLAVSPGFAQVSREGGEVIDQLELRSIFAIRGDPQFSVHDPVRDMSFWIALGETRHGIEVTEYDADNDQIVVRHGNDTRTLGLSEPEIAPLETAETGDGPTNRDNASYARRSGQRNPEERMRHIIETWESAMEENFQLREIDEHFGEYYDEFQSLRQRMWNTTDHDSREFQDLRERRQELRQEMRVLSELTQREIEDNAAFDDIDRRALLATLRHRHASNNSDRDN